MPELPDVVGFKRYLDATSLHQTIETTHCLDERFIKDVSRTRLQRKLKGAELEHSRRWGKWLFVRLSTDGFLVLHFGMTGQLDYATDDGDLPDYTKLSLHFTNGKRLAIISRRILGQVSFTTEVGPFAESHGLGPDALNVSFDQFRNILQGRRGAAKSTLMNQGIIAGIGNVYSDEILFQARLDPRTSLDALDDAKLDELYRLTRDVLEEAIRHGAEPAEYPDDWLTPHRGEDERCPRCGGAIERTEVSGRGAYWCPSCQRRPGGNEEEAAG